MGNQLQFVFDQALNGHHHLLDPSILRAALLRQRAEGAWVDTSTAREAEQLIEQLGQQHGVLAQRTRIAQASAEVQEVFAHLYVDFLYRYLERRRPTFH